MEGAIYQMAVKSTRQLSKIYVSNPELSDSWVSILEFHTHCHVNVHGKLFHCLYFFKNLYRANKGMYLVT